MSGDQDNPRLLRRFVRDFGLYSIASFVPSILGVIALIVFTRVFLPGAYGRYALVTAFAIIVSTLMFGWLQQAILRFQTETEPSILASNLVLLLLVIGVLGLVVGTTGYLFLGPYLGAYTPFYLGALVLVLARGVYLVLRAFFRAQLESIRVTTFDVLKAVLTLVLALVLAISVLDSIVGWIWGAAVATAITALVMIYRSKEFHVTPSFDSTLCTRVFWFGAPMVIWLLGLTLLNFADRLLLESLQGSTAVGIYSANYTIVNSGLPLVLTPIIQTVHPIIMDSWNGNNDGEVSALVTEFTRYYLILAVPATAFAAVASRPLSTLLLGSAFRSGYIIIPVVALGLFFWYLAMLGHKGLEVQERTAILATGVTITALVNIILNIPLITAFGYLGAAVATLLSFLLYTILVYFISLRYIPWKLPRKTIRNTTIGGSAVILPSFLMISQWNLSTDDILIVAGAGAIVYAAVLYLLDEFREQELATLKIYLRSWYRA